MENNIPSRDSDFNDFQDSFITVITANMVAWGFVAAELALLTAAQSIWVAAWVLAKNKDNRTRAQINAKTAARKGYTGVLRPFIQDRIYRNSLMTDENRLECGIKPHDKKRTPITQPTGTPEIKVLAGPGNAVRVYFAPPKAGDGSKLRGKPKGVSGMVVAFQKGGTPPANPEVCTKFDILSRSPKHVTFSPDEVGQRVYLFGCWVNSKGDRGPWTDLQSFMVP